MLRFEGGEADVSTWWKPHFAKAGSVDPDDAPAQLLALLEDSVHRQMQVDVPFGAYLSGGVDSSAVVALMSRQLDSRVKTFTLAYDDADLPNKDADRRYAQQVATLFGTEHHETVLNHKDLLPVIDAIVGSFDEPFSGVISTYFLTELISRHVKVALSGDGADELFGPMRPTAWRDRSCPATPRARAGAGTGAAMSPGSRPMMRASPSR